MLIKKPDDIKGSEITDPQVYARRREVLKAAAALGIGAIAGQAQALVGPVVKGMPIGDVLDSQYGRDLQPTAYEHVTGYNNFYEFGTVKGDPARNAHTLKTRPWTVVVDGECEAPGEIGIEDILSGFTQEERIYRLRCVEAWLMVVPWVGFPLGDLLKRFKPTSRAAYVRFETLVDKEQMPGQRRPVLDWPYREGLRMDEAMHPLTIIATGLYGEVLPNQNGAPLRLATPNKYGIKCLKRIGVIRYTNERPADYWAERSYDWYAGL